MKHLIKLTVSIETPPELKGDDARIEAQRIAQFFCNIKNQHGCEYCGATLKFSVASGADPID
jgi:hypothetical protein